MKTKPSVGDVVFYYNDLGERLDYKIADIKGDTLYFLNRESAHYKKFQGRIVKKPRKCEECAKPKQLFYVGHDHEGGANLHGYVIRTDRRTAIGWPYISALALISTEEVKK